MLVLNNAEITGLVSLNEVLAAIETSFEVEAAGAVTVPPRQTLDHPDGWIRFMPAIVSGAGVNVMGAKIMNLVSRDNDRVQYLILLYNSCSGQLLAMLDGALITQLRTGATTAVVARQIVGSEPIELGLIGTGFVAEGQLRAVASAVKLSRVTVYSRNTDKRKRFAEVVGKQIGVEIQAEDSMDAVLTRNKVVIVATRSPKPVVDGNAFLSGSTVLSIGSTRPHLHELDARTLQRSRCILTDHVEQTLNESGDVQAALRDGDIEPDQLMPVSALWRSAGLPTSPGRDLITFKSSGTALQDLLVAQAVYEKAVAAGLGQEVRDVPGFRMLSEVHG